MTSNDGGSAVTPGAPGEAAPPITAAELRQARDGLLRAQARALDALHRALAECAQTTPGTPAVAATLTLGEERGDLTRDLLCRLPAIAASVRT